MRDLIESALFSHRIKKERERIRREFLNKYRESVREDIEACETSEQLNASDLNIVINAKVP